MDSPQELLDSVPSWVLRPLPVNSVVDPKLMREVDRLCAALPKSLLDLLNLLNVSASLRSYDAAVNRAAAQVWKALPQLWSGDADSKSILVSLAEKHFTPRARMRVFRRLSKHPNSVVRRNVHRAVVAMPFQEVTVPRSVNDDHPEASNWSTTGWFSGTEPNRLRRERAVEKRLIDALPDLPDLQAVRTLLGIKSPRQLGWMLLATNAVEHAPYVTFTIPKRDGSARTICAPKFSLLRVQRRILSHILNLVPCHPAAHGFVRGRSTVTNAAPHLGAQLLLKFDLEDFFPTIHYYRVVGLFLSLGYGITTGRFSTGDRSIDIAPVLARLCCFTYQPRRFGLGHLPQGAPSSPAISNLICRRLDARLTGLATKFGGVYTRYADDLTFSFPDPQIDVARFRWWVDQLCHQEGFFVNQPKFRVIRSSQRQTVTGIVVNDTMQIPREARRRFRAMLHNCEKHGIAAASRGETGFASYLRGFASYYAMVTPEEGRAALKAVNAVLLRTAEGTP